MFAYLLDDLKQLITHPAGRGTLLALMIIPGFYAWFNIVASRDPYGHTENITIAVVNNDTGTIIGDQKLTIGASVIENLRDNHSLGWRILDEYQAQDGVLKGKYYASIIIPEDFSNKLLSFLTSEPTKPVLQYTVNEKINAIAPKITNAGMEGVSKAIEANFISSVYNKLFEKTNHIGKKFASHRKDFQHVQELTNDIMGKLPDIHTNLKQ